MKLINDTLKNTDGKYSRKSLTAFFAFIFALSYEVIPLFVKGFDTKEYVFITLISLCGASLGLTVLDKNQKE